MFLFRICVYMVTHCNMGNNNMSLNTYMQMIILYGNKVQKLRYAILKIWKKYRILDEPF